MSTTRAVGPDELSRAHWRKSTRSANSGNCVEVADLAHGHRAVRDSKDANGPALIFTPGEWSAFTASVRAGKFE
ncbi:MAG: DUF397 domain-containing protein [Pseudonocardiaceae bacterium]|nr:DUF397 domain-containing protein [Pseudonocardiaceae bacterium]